MTIKILFRCTIEKILTITINPSKGNLKGHSSKVFEITINSKHQPAIITSMLDVSYTLVSENEIYKQSLLNYNTNKQKLDGVFMINKCGNYKPVIILK